jgi:hypothetical protein
MEIAPWAGTSGLGLLPTIVIIIIISVALGLIILKLNKNGTYRVKLITVKSECLDVQEKNLKKRDDEWYKKADFGYRDSNLPNRHGFCNAMPKEWTSRFKLFGKLESR